MRQGVKTELKEGKLCGMEDRGRGTLWKGMKKQTRSKQLRSESPEKLPAFTGGSEALEMGRKLPTSNPPGQEEWVENFVAVVGGFISCAGRPGGAYSK